MQQPRRIIFWIHLALGILTGIAGAFMAGTAVIMAFADSYLDVREHASRHVTPPPSGQPLSLDHLAALVATKHNGQPVIRVGLDRNPERALEFYRDKDGLDYADPFTGELRPSDSVPLRRWLHKGVEQWHRFFGLTGEHRATGKWFASWFNAALLPLLLTGLVLWWPARLHWPVLRAGLLPAGGGRGRGTHRSWHASIGFWALPFLLIMVLTGTTHSFAWVRNTVYGMTGSGPPKPGSNDSLWPPNLAKRPVPDKAIPLSLDALRGIADSALPGWKRLDIFPAPRAEAGSKADTARLLAQAPGWGPGFFPVVVQVDPYSGDVLDVHSWDDLSAGTRLLAWSRWLHKGEAFGRFGQIVAGGACLLFIGLFVTGWLLALRRLRARYRAT